MVLKNLTSISIITFISLWSTTGNAQDKSVPVQAADTNVGRTLDAPVNKKPSALSVI